MNKTEANWCWNELQNIRRGTVTYWGVMTKKLPLDMWIFQEIVAERKPEVIVEVGNLHGGSTLFLAHLLDVIGKGEVVAADIDHDRYKAPAHPRITKMTGDIADSRLVDSIKTIVGGRSCMVIHDAQHSWKFALRDLENLHGLVTKGQYFVMEDGVIDEWKPGTGPMTAVKKFLPGHPEFRVDASRERYGMTWNPMGYLERVR